VQGERPYSVWKIAFAVILGVIALAGTLLVVQQNGGVHQVHYYR